VSAHPWRLVAPWYRWDRFAGVHPRDTPPVLQKYETPGLVAEMLANPQRSLRFTDEDLVYETVFGPPRVGRATSLSRASIAVSDPPRRKLFLASHKRFYLVVCELHCDGPGFPDATRDATCQAGMVVRRRRLVVPDAAAGDVTRHARRISRRAAQVAVLERRAVSPRLTVQGRGAHPAAARAAYGRSLHERRTRAVAALEDDQRALATAAIGAGARWALEGWVASELQGVGEWAELDDARPQALDEAVLPLYPLIADPRADGHAATGRAIWFGLLPTGSADVDVDGAARFDDATRYEVSCFVRRHDEGCPRASDGRRRADCRGELVWSVPTEGYQLASHFDLVGTSNRPVTIQLPDIRALGAQAASIPFGEGAALRLRSPEGSSMQFGVKDLRPVGASLGGAEVSALSIPLVTIVATFLLKLFLPIVVMAFGLWSLLRLRCSWPPAMPTSAQVEAAFARLADTVAVDADAALRAGLRAELDERAGGGLAGALGAGAQMTASFENSVLVRLQHELGNAPPSTATTPAEIPSPNGLARLQWEGEVPVP
jgi:hypothetical protein